jgi:hypothetical protein
MAKIVKSRSPTFGITHVGSIEEAPHKTSNAGLAIAMELPVLSIAQ